MKKEILDAMSWLVSHTEINQSNLKNAKELRNEILANLTDKEIAKHFEFLSDKILESSNKIPMYICYIWRYNCDSQSMLSREGESFEDFKQRVQYIFPYTENWHYRYSEFKEIW